MSNWITKLKEESARKDREIEQLRAGITLLHAYLGLPKFHKDTTVQVGDIILRLREIASATGEES